MVNYPQTKDSWVSLELKYERMQEMNYEQKYKEVLERVRDSFTYLDYPGQKSDWSEEDNYKVQRICMYLNEAKKYYADITEVRECIEWLKSLKERINYKKGGEE